MTISALNGFSGELIGWLVGVERGRKRDELTSFAKGPI